MTLTPRIVLLLVALAATFWAGWEWRDRSADIKQLRSDLAFAKAANDALVETLDIERAIAATQTVAGDTANTREEQIHADFDTRIAAAVAGRDSELGRVRSLWGQCETRLLSSGTAAAAEAAEENRLRDASAARIVRAAELAQSERDEAIDRYEAVRLATAEASRP